MNVQEFQAKWRNTALKESAGAQEHFIDLCRMLGQPTPAGCCALFGTVTD